MKRIFTFFWVFVFSCFSSFAQNIQNILEMHYCDIKSLEIDSEGNTIIAGFLSDSLIVEGEEIDISLEEVYADNFNLFLAKFSPTNQLVWIQRGYVSLYSNGKIDNVTIDIDVKLDGNDNIYTFITKSSQRYRAEDTFIIWEDSRFEATNNLLCKFRANGVIEWAKPWIANNHPSINRDRDRNYTSNGSLLAVNKRGDIFISSEIKPHNTIKTIIDADTILVKHASNLESQEHWSDPAMLLLRFDSNSNLVYYRTALIEPLQIGISDDVRVSAHDIAINEKRELFLLTKISGTAFFDTGESIDPTYNWSHFISYDSLGQNMTHNESYPIDSDYKLDLVQDDIYLNLGNETRLVAPNTHENTIRQNKLSNTGQLISEEILASFITENVSFSLSNILTDEIGNNYFICNVNSSAQGIIYLDKNYEFDNSIATYSLIIKANNGEIVWSSIYNVVNGGYDWYFSGVVEKEIYLRADGKGNIYFNDLYEPGLTIGGVNMPNNLFYNGMFVVTMTDEGFRYPAFGGKTFAETNNNCAPDATDFNLPSVLIKRNDGKLGISDKQGNYSLSFAEEGTYTLNSQPIDNTSFISNYLYDNCGTSKEIIYRDGQITNPENLNFGYKVKPCSYLSVDITNQRRRRCFMSTTTVEYQNKGFADAQNVEVKVEYPDYIFPVSSSPAWTRKEGKSYFFNVGRLAAGDVKKVVFQDSVICGIEEIRGLTQCVKATISPANSCEEWTDNENKYEISGRCVGGGVARYTIKNLTNTATDSIPYRLYANSKLFAERNTLLPANGEVEIEVFTNGMTMRMELFPQNHDPISTFVEGCQIVIPYKTKAENPNPVVSVAPVQESGVALPQNDGGERSETSCSEILDSYDPNDKQVVPFGLTNQNLIEKTTELDYTIRFQNTGTIEAVNIVVLDTLSEFLDIETIRLGMVSHDYKLLIDGDADTRVLRFQFDNINLPDSNTNEPASHGFIKFKIKQKANNRIGTVIKNRAAIYFDFNSPIITNTISNKVAILPLRDNNLNLPVFNCSDASFELNANAGTDIETPNSTATLSAQATQVFGNWSLLSGFGELENPSKNNSKVTGLLPFPTKLVWRVAACGEAKQDTVIVQSTNTDYKFTIDFNQTESKLSVPTGKVTYQWYRDGVLITGQTGAKLDLSTLENRIGVYTVVISSGDTSVTSEPFTIDRILSNDDFIKANYIKIYPNPTTSLLNVELNTILNASEVTLVNALGMELQTTKIINSDKITLDLNNLSNGIYFVKIVSQKGIFYKKVVLKK